MIRGVAYLLKFVAYEQAEKGKSLELYLTINYWYRKFFKHILFISFIASIRLQDQITVLKSCDIDYYFSRLNL